MLKNGYITGQIREKNGDVFTFPLNYPNLNIFLATCTILRFPLP